MCVKGTNNLMGCGMSIAGGSAFLGCGLLMGAGVICGIIHGWHTLAISLIILGGVVLVPGYIGGINVMKRAQELKREERNSIVKASQIYQARQENL